MTAYPGFSRPGQAIAAVYCPAFSPPAFSARTPAYWPAFGLHILLAASAAGAAVWLAPSAHAAETAPNAAHLHYPHTSVPVRRAPATTVVPAKEAPAEVTSSAAPAAKPGFWDNARLLPPLTSRPEAYGQPQSLELSPLPTALLHQGPWGVFNANTGAAAGFGTVGYYAVSRWAEDWSSLRDKRNRLDAMDALKYIPFNQEGDIYLSFSGNFRQHNFYDQRAGFGTIKKDPAYRNNFRWNLGADLHLGEHVRLYGELMSGQAAGVNYYGYAGGRWRSKLDAQQAFVEVRGKVLGATVGGMAGRMTFLDAPPYFTAGSVYPTLPYSWNGLRGYAFWKNFRVDGFYLTLTDNSPPIAFHDTVGWRSRLFGAYTSYALPKFSFLGKSSQVFVDSFYYGIILASSALPTAAGGSIAGSTHRDTPGMRVWGNAGPLEFSVGGMWQGGEFRAAKSGPTRPVSAYSVNATLSWRFAKWAGHPAVGIQVDDVSGGNMNKSQSSSWGSFLSPYVPSAYYLDISTYIGQSNIIDVGPIATVSPTPNTTLLMKVPWCGATANRMPFMPAARLFITCAHTGPIQPPCRRPALRGVPRATLR